MNEASDEDRSMHESAQESSSIENLEQPTPYTYHLRVPFPSELAAESAMKALGVDKAFQDSKTRKTTIKRDLSVEVLEDGVAYLNIVLSCDPDMPNEIQSLRTCASSTITNLTLVCQTIKFALSAN